MVENVKATTPTATATTDESEVNDDNETNSKQQKEIISVCEVNTFP